MLLASLGINIVYQCGVKDFDMTALDAAVDTHGGSHFAIVFHGGGNFGDLYGTEHGLKLNVMRAYPDIRTHIFPQSLKFRSDETTEATKVVLAKLKHASIAVRDQQSYDFAMKHFKHPGLRVDLTPDIVFYMGFRPELKKLFGAPTKDVLLFRRADGERTDWGWAGKASTPGFPGPFIETLSPAGKPLTYKHGDWSGDFDLTEEETSELSESHIQFRAWRRFMQGSEWLSSADFVILDRLHGGS
jgi:exopolysaccharide biosynthesis predicted pyruvyltransferase EpsI